MINKENTIYVEKDEKEHLKNIKESKGCIFMHFKGDKYLILDFAEDCDSGETYVVYKALYGDNKVYIRELNNFADKLPEERLNECKIDSPYRFTRIIIQSVKER